MSKYLERPLFILVVALSFISFDIVFTSPQEKENQQNEFVPQNPRYELKLSLNEYSVFNSSLVDGLNRFGGVVEFDLKMAREENEVVWTITFNNQRLLEIFEYWLSLKSVEFVQIIDVDNLDTNSKLALKSIKSLTEKVVYAQKNPIWDLVRMPGTINREIKDWYVNGAYGKYKIKGDIVSEIAKFEGRRIIIHGYIKTEDEIEVVRIQQIKENTLELFVMSKCPFGQEAEISLLNFLERFHGKSKPSLEIHYIFYRQTSGNKTTYTSLHGEEEVNENLIQIVIKDRYFQFFYDYLKIRASNNAPWYELAADIGLKENDIQTIRNIIANERDHLIQKQYDYATNIYQIYDGSPTYVWEGEKQENIRDIEIFKDIKSTSEGCSN